MTRTATSPTGMPISALLAEDSSVNNHENVSDKDIETAPQFSHRKRSYLQTLAGKLSEIENEEAMRIKYRRIAYENSLENRFHSRASLSRHIAYASLRDVAAANVLHQIEQQEQERRRAYQRIAQRKRRQALKSSTAPVPDSEAAEDASVETGSVNGDDQNRPADSEPTLPTRRKRAASRRALDAAAAAAANNEDDTSIESDEPHAQPESTVKRKIVLSKNYNSVYETIFKDIARKDVPKVYRILITSVHNKQSNARKTAQLAAKEARRWQFRTNKSIKDLQNRAKRGMREMLVFWKRNEREEREQRRKAEKEAVEFAKREEEQREARRQARKLNFLITQTELYSHFVGKKIKTDELEGTETPSHTATPSLTASDSAPSVGPIKATDVKSLDFDSVDENDLRNMAMANAQNAVADAKSRAEKFNSKAAAADAMDQLDDNGELNFQNPTSLGDIEISQPKLLSCTLKEYQMKGLNWLVNLYEQGINGILADEMGLGKTVQSISVMAYLAETHNIWGPFLVIAPASTLHNWQQEISRFVPEFKILPYWGSGKDRKVLRKFWDRKHPTYTKDSPFHVLITSYQLVVADAPHFLRLKWQYMILDEAQAIKSSSSSRWKSLLSLHCRNRLLLTGTPIQNTMQELWALLHFIMPTLFDSHDEFSEWFSKDIESHAQSNTQLNEAQLRRLHMILKPFMLRRVKKNVQSELGDKIEVDVFCKLTYTQRALYRQLKSQINLDLIEKAASGGDDDSLMNLVMQFRKVCNHPDLFERADTASPYSFGSIPLTGAFIREGNHLYLSYSARNLIDYNLPNLLYKEGGIFDVPGRSNFFVGFKRHYLENVMSVWSPDYIHDGKQQSGSSFGWLSFAAVSEYEAHKIASRGIFERTYDLAVNSESNYRPGKSKLERLLTIPKRVEQLSADPKSILYDLCHVSSKRFKDERLNRIEPIFDPRATAPPIQIVVSETNWINRQRNIMFNPLARTLVFGKPQEIVDRHLYDWSSLCRLSPIQNRLPPPSSELRSYSSIRVPSMAKFILASGKLSKLDSLLANLKANDHRVLIYFQMTRMMDLMEEYLTYRQYRYLRLDGSSKLSDRRDLVHDWQTRPELFVFLLSTRAGGLGINLTAADTVIFYDSDWNPTIDSQAMDRAHRLGQTKQVTVYRLLVRGTIEEKMRDRAKQKMHVQQVVMEGGKPSIDLNASKPQPSREVAMWLLDDATADGTSGMEEPEAETVVSSAA